MSRQLSDFINNELASLASLSSTPFEPYIFRVDGPLRRENKKAYEPEKLAVGPYHHSKSNLKMMEEHKLRFLQLLLKRRNESSVDRYVNAMQDLEEKTRKSYIEFVGLGKDEFVRMMLLDGCFMIELFRKFEDHTYKNDPILKSEKFSNILHRDLLLFENQLPFFVLVLLFNMTKNPNQERNIFSSTLMFFARFNLNVSSVPSHDVDHVLGLVYKSWCSSFAATLSSRGNYANQGSRWEFIKCATDLREAGIKFEKATESSSLMDIKFENGIIKIPPLIIDDSAEILFRNMIAYERYNGSTETAYMIHYLTFLDHLVKLCNNIILDRKHFYYLEVFNKVNKHCKLHQPRWMAKLRHNNFNSSWSIISLFGVTLLLLLTIIQTICSVLQVS